MKSLENIKMMESIILIENFEDEKKLHDITKKFPNAKLFSLNYQTHKHLEKLNISHYVGERYLDKNDMESADLNAVELTQSWYNHDEIKNFLIYKQTNLAYFLELDLLRYFIDIFKTIKTIQNIISKEKPKNIIALTSMNDFIKQLTIYKKIDFFHIDSENLKKLHYDRINIKFNLKSLPISFNISRSKFQKIKQISEIFLYKIFNLYSKPSTLDSILLLDFNPTIYENLLIELSKSNKKILLLNQRRPAIWNFKSLRIIRNSNAKIIDLNSYSHFLSTSELDHARNSFIKLQDMWNFEKFFEEIFSIENISFWNSIKKSFMETCNRRFEESIRRILLLEKLFEKNKIINILEWAETGQEEKEVLSVAKRMQINSVMLQHAMYSTAKIWEKFGRFLARFSYPLISNQQAVWGDLTEEYAISHGNTPSKIFKTGSPRHDPFFNYKTTKTESGLVLLATTGASGIFTQGSTTDIFIKFDNFVREVYEVMKKFPDKKLIVKPHPQSDFINNVTQLIKDIDPEIPIIYDTDLPELISQCDAVISFNTSTILLESIIMNKPAIDLQIEDWVHEHEITKMNAIYSIDSINQIEDGLRKVLYDVNTKNELEKNSKIFIDKFLVNHGNASKHVSDLLTNR